MSTSATRIQRARLVDTIGVLAIVAGLVLGLVPGISPVVPAWASPAVNLDQCANDISNTDSRQSCVWVNGNLNKNNSVYAEGDSVAFRATVTGLTSGRYYEVPFTYDLQKSGYIGYDTITAWNHSESGDPLAGVSGVAGGMGSETWENIDLNPQTATTVGAPYGVIVTGAPEDSDTGVSLFGGTWDTTNGAIEHTGADGTIAAGVNQTIESRFVFRFQASGSTVVLAWGGHIALRQDWNPHGYTTGPQDTNGSPYHMRNGTPTGEKSTVDGPYTYNKIGQQDRSLKAGAVVLPGALDIIKKDAEGNLLSGFSFEVYDKDGQKAFDCTTGAGESCRADDLPAGDYTVKEVDADTGYVLDTTVKPVTVGELATAEVVFTNQRKDYSIEVAPDGRNALGKTHSFIVTLKEDTSPLADAEIDLAWRGKGSIQSITTAVDADTCKTNASGECTVVVTSEEVGDGELTATYDTPYQHDDGAGDGGVSTDGELVETISDSGDKTWVGYVAKVEQTATNLVSHDSGTQGQHVFTVTVREDDGSGTLTLPGTSVEVTVTWTGAPAAATIVDSDDALNPSDLTCDTVLATGTCTFTVDSSTSGAGDITVTKLDGVILGLDDNSSLDDEKRIEEPAKVIPGEGNLLTATKTWREYRAKLDGDAVNPVDAPHKFDVTVQYRDVEDGTWTDAAEGLFVDWTPGANDVGSDDLALSTCDDDPNDSSDGTDGNGKCEIWVTSGNVGSRTVTLTEVSGALLPNDATSYSFPVSASQFLADASDDDTDNVAKKTWVGFSATITPTENNQVGEPHTFTVKVFRDGGGSGNAVPEGTVVNTTVTWHQMDPSNQVVRNTCEDLTAGTVDDTCYVTVNSGAAGKVTVAVDGIDDYVFDAQTTGDVTFTPTPSASKTWWAYRAWVEPDATNVVGDPHTFKVHAQRNDGTGWTDVQDGTIVTVEQGGDVGAISTNDCETENVGTSGGTCDVVVTSLSPGPLTMTVKTVQARDAVDSALPNADNPLADISAGAYLNTQPEESGQSVMATKTWVEYQADIRASETNLTGQAHTFHVAVTQDIGDGNGPQPVPAGTSVTLDTAGHAYSGTCRSDGTGNDPRTDTAETNVCTVVVTSNDVRSVTVAVTAVGAQITEQTSATAANGELTAAATAYDPDNPETTEAGSLSAVKDWINISVATTATATNIVDDPHRFDVDVTVDAPGPLDPWDLDSVTVTQAPGGVGQIDSQTCADPADGEQSCTVTVSSSEPGQLKIIVTEVAFTYGGKQFVVDLAADDASTAGEAATQDLDATKTWRAYRSTIESDGLNRVRDAHEFTVTIEQTDVADPGDGDWSGVEGAEPTVTRKGVGVGDVVADTGTCDEGTDELGQCTVWVDSSVSGTGTFEVSSIRVVDPGSSGEVASWRDLPSGHAAFDNTDTADKTWAAFRGLVSRDSANTTGDAHTFHVDVEYTTDGATWTQIPDTSSVVVSDDSDGGDAVGDIDSHTCGSTTGVSGVTGVPDHVCTVTVASDASGSLTVSLTSVTADITINAETDAPINEEFTVEFGREENGDPKPGLLSNFDDPALARTVDDRDIDDKDTDDYASTKTWATYQLLLSPETAVNLLNSSLEEDPEESHTITARLTSDDPADGGLAPIVGQGIDFTVSGAGVTFDGGGTTASCVTVADDPDTEDADEAGTCTVDITSDSPAHATVNATYDARVGDSQASTTIQGDADAQEDGFQPATKTWTTFLLTVTPEQAVNLVDSPHLFTVTLWESVLTADCQDPVDDFCLVDTDDSIQIDVAGDDLDVVTDCGKGTNSDGQCFVTVTSGTVQAATLTATYRERYANYDSATTSLAAVFSDYSGSGGKSWIHYDIDVVGDDENLVDTPHTFTVELSTIVPDGEGGTTRIGIEGAHPTVEIDGRGTIEANTCAPGQQGTVVDDAAPEVGTCTVTITSAVAGVTTIDASYLGYARIPDDDIADHPDDESRTYDTSETEEEDTGDKLWVDYRLTLGDDAVNAVGDPHTFTATLTRSEDGEADEDFLPARGERLEFAVSGVGAVTDGGDVDGDLACTTDEAGQCDIVINSDEGGTTTVGVSHDAVVGATSATFTDTAVKQWVDIDLVKTAVVGDGFDDGDLVEDPGTGLPTLLFTTSDRGPKTAVFEYVITNTGGGDLFDLALVDDRLGGIDLEGQSDCPDVLAVGASCTARAVETFTYEDAAGGLDNIITNVGLVTASGDDGSEVSATDDAVIQLVAQQSSILIDLVKGVVSDAGDVDGAGGVPTVTWSQEEFEAGTSKTVRYRFTVTNVGPSPIVDVELSDPMISSQPIIAAADGVTLQPGESTVVEVDHELTAAEAFPEGPTAGEVPNVATVRGANEARDAFDEDVDDAIVFVQVVFSEVEQPSVVKAAVLPATGLGNGGLLPLSILLIAFGTAVLWLERRRRSGS